MTRTWVLFLAGPVIWLAHFLAVYVLVEAGCAAGGLGFTVDGISGVSLVTLAATAVAAGGTVVFARVAYRRWRASEADSTADPTAGFAAFLLAALFVLAIVAVGLPALWLGC